MHTKIISAIFLAGACIVSQPAFASTSSDQSGDKIIASQPIGSSTQDSWKKHYSYSFALEIRQAGVWDDIWTQAPDTWITRGKFIDLLNRVTGSSNQSHTLESGQQTYLTRAEAATWIDTCTAFNTGVSNEHAPFQDVTAETKDRAGIDYVYHTGLMLGDGRHFMPQEFLTDGQAAIVLDRILHRIGGIAKPVTYQDVTSNLPESAYTMVNENKTEPGLYSVVDGNVRYIMVAAGTKPTTGYSISVQSVTQTDGALYVNTTTYSPKPGEIEAMHVTYPYVVVKVSDTQKPVFWVNQEEANR